MATVSVTTSTTSVKGVKQVRWDSLAAGDDGSPIATIGSKTSVQVVGTPGTSTVTIQGSNDGTNWVNLNDEANPGSACSFTAAGLKGVLQYPAYIRPIVSAGTGAGLSVILINK